MEEGGNTVPASHPERNSRGTRELHGGTHWTSGGTGRLHGGKGSTSGGTGRTSDLFGKVRRRRRCC